MHTDSVFRVVECLCISDPSRMWGADLIRHHSPPLLCGFHDNCECNDAEKHRPCSDTVLHPHADAVRERGHRGGVYFRTSSILQAWPLTTPRLAEKNRENS